MPRICCFFILPAVLSLVLLSGCGHLSKAGNGESADRQSWKKTELYFGLHRTNTEQWKGFVREVILPKFPQGFTVVEAKGYWLPEGFSKTQEEASKVLVILHPGSWKMEKDLETIRSEYKRRFRQESVLRVDYPARVSF